MGEYFCGVADTDNNSGTRVPAGVVLAGTTAVVRGAVVVIVMGTVVACVVTGTVTCVPGGLGSAPGNQEDDDRAKDQGGKSHNPVWSGLVKLASY